MYGLFTGYLKPGFGELWDMNGLCTGLFRVFMGYVRGFTGYGRVFTTFPAFFCLLTHKCRLGSLNQPTTSGIPYDQASELYLHYANVVANADGYLIANKSKPLQALRSQRGPDRLHH